MPDTWVAVAWMILAPVALIFHVLSLIFMQHYRPLYHSSDVALISLLITAALTSYFVIPIPAVLELAGWDWNHGSCNFYTWLSSTVRFSHLLGLVVLNVYWVNSLRANARHGHIFMSSFCMKISVVISWFVSVVVGLVPVTGGTELFGFYTSSSCHFMPSSISIGFGILFIISSLSCIIMGVTSSTDTLMIFRSMKHVTLTKYNAGRFPMPAAGVSGVARSTGSNVHARYSELSVATELCKLALCLTVVSSCLNIIPFVVIQFILLFDNKHRGTFEDLTLWLQLIEALILPHLMWMLSGRYRHAIVYAWKVYVMKDSSAKEEDASLCTLQSYKTHAMESHQNHQSKATLNGLKKIQPPRMGRLGFDLYSRDAFNGNGGPNTTQLATPLRMALSPASSTSSTLSTNNSNSTSTFRPCANGTTAADPLTQPATSSGTRRPSGNKICPIEQKVNGRDGSQGFMLSSPSESFSVTDLDDGMAVLSNVPHQASTESRNNVGSFETTSIHNPHLSNGVVGQTEVQSNDIYSRPMQKIKPLRKNLIKSPAQGPKLAFVDVSETSSGPGSPQIPASAVSSPAKSMLGTPKRDIDVKRTASACSRREWKEKMRKKHLPAIFVSNSVEDEKDVGVYSNIDDEMNETHGSDSKNNPVSFEMKEVEESEVSTRTVDTEIMTDNKQQSFSEDNFYVSSEYHYNYLSDSFPRKVSLRTQSTVDSDGVCDMYESDDIGTILDNSSMVSDSTSNVGILPNNNKTIPLETNVILENEIARTNNGENEIEEIDITHTNKTVKVQPVTITASDSDKNMRNSLFPVKSSLEEFEENERNAMTSDSIDSVMEMERPVSRLKLIDLEANIGKETNSRSTNESNNMHDDSNVNSEHFQAVSQDYNELETVSGSELLHLKQHVVKTVKAAHEITFDSSSDGGGVDNEAFEGDGDSARDDGNSELVGLKRNGTFTGDTEIAANSGNIDTSVLPQDMTERYVSGKEDSEESGSNQDNEQDGDRKSILLNENNPFGSVKTQNINSNFENGDHVNNGKSLKRDDFKTNPFLRESFEVLVQSPEYQQKMKSPDNPFFISVKPLALPRQKTLESIRDSSASSSNHSVSGVQEENEAGNKNIFSKPPLPSKPAVASTSAARVKPRHDSVGDNKPITAKPPVPVRKPHHLRKQNSLENQSSEREGENNLNRPRTSSEDELEKIFVTKENSNNSTESSILQEDPLFPGEDPHSSLISSNEGSDSPVFYSMSPVKEQKINLSHSLSNDRQSINSDCSIVIEPYGQRRPPWLDESLESDQQSGDTSFSISVPVTSHYSPGFTPRSKGDNRVEEYDFDSVKIRGVVETQNGNNDYLKSGTKSSSGSSIFYSSTGSDTSNNKITPVSAEERPTFQFYQFDDDIDKGFEDALSVDYLTHTNVYSGFGLCFESIKEEPEDSLSESTSSFDGLGESNNSALFKTQAIISRPSSRASVSSSPNLEVNGNIGGGLNDSNGSSNRLSVYPEVDQSNFNFGTMEDVNYENFASAENGSFVTSERTSGDGREEVMVHSNGNSSVNTIQSTTDPWSFVTHSNKSNFQKNADTSKMENNSSPWLEVKSVDLDMSFESDFSVQNETYITDSRDLEQSSKDNKQKSIEENFETLSVNGNHSNSGAAKTTEKTGKPKTHTIHYQPVYF